MRILISSPKRGLNHHFLFFQRAGQNMNSGSTGWVFSVKDHIESFIIELQPAKKSSHWKFHYRIAASKIIDHNALFYVVAPYQDKCESSTTWNTVSTSNTTMSISTSTTTPQSSNFTSNSTSSTEESGTTNRPQGITTSEGEVSMSSTQSKANVISSTSHMSLRKGAWLQGKICKIQCQPKTVIMVGKGKSVIIDILSDYFTYQFEFLKWYLLAKFVTDGSFSHNDRYVITINKKVLY